MKYSVYYFLILITLLSCVDSDKAADDKAHLRVKEEDPKPLIDSTDFYKVKHTQLIDSISDYFDYRKKLGLFNGSVLLAYKDMVLFEDVFGIKNHKGDSLSRSDAFDLASCSKPLTACAIMQLYEAGKIQLNDSVQVYVPEFPYKDITIQIY